MLALKQVHRALVLLDKETKSRGQEGTTHQGKSKESQLVAASTSTASQVASSASASSLTSSVKAGSSGEKSKKKFGLGVTPGNTNANFSYEKELAVDLFFIMVDCLHDHNSTVAQRTAFLHDLCPIVDAVRFWLLRHYGEVIPRSLDMGNVNKNMNSSATVIASSLLDTHDSNHHQQYHQRQQHQHHHHRHQHVSAPFSSAPQSSGKFFLCA